MTTSDSVMLHNAFESFTDAWRNELLLAFHECNVPVYRHDVASWSDDKVIAVGYAYLWNAERAAAAHQ